MSARYNAEDDEAEGKEFQCCRGERKNTLKQSKATFFSKASNRLLYYDGITKITFIVSHYAGYLLATRLGSDLVRQLAQLICRSKLPRTANNPALEGWLFEAWFFACVKQPSGLTLHGAAVMDPWVCSGWNDIDIPLPEWFDIAESGGTWYKPIKWNQGGYDAVYILSLIHI